MTQITNEDDVRGEVLRVWNDAYENALLIVFADGRYAYYHARSGYDGDLSVDFEDEPPDYELLHRAGLIAPEEYVRRQAEEQARTRMESERRERELLARLQAKYGA